MRLWVYFLLTAVSVWGFSDNRVGDKVRLAQLSQSQDKDNRVRDTQRDCKPKCGPSIAQKAAAEAKAAQAAQNAAGAQAAHMVKTQLAEKALQAAKAAEAALAGKQAIVEQLQQEVKQAEAVICQNSASVHQQQGTVNAAIAAAQQATSEHKLLMQAAQLAAQLEKTAQNVLEKTKLGHQDKSHHLAEARTRLAHLQHKLQCACAEYSATKQAAQAASEAARAACGNARKRKKKHVNHQTALVLKHKKIEKR